MILFEKHFRKLIAAHKYLQHVQYRWNNYEIIFAAKIILFQFQT